jgi:hypothetical protein
MTTFSKKIKKRVWEKIIASTRNYEVYPFLYSSYWHGLFFSRRVNAVEKQLYLTARPNPGAGIGHQLANWIAGYWWAGQFRLKFAHIPFSNEKWEYFLGFGEGEVAHSELLAKGFQLVKLPLFSEDNQGELKRIKRIIQSYSGDNVVFVCEQDQGYRQQFGNMAELQRKFFNAKARSENRLLYSSDYFNIAVHVRRGDIVQGQVDGNQNLQMRWQNNDYFVNVLTNVLKTMKPDRSVAIYVFSQGVESDFVEFNPFPSLHFCLDMNAQDSFLHMVYADLLITSKSSFSYKPALLNKGIKLCPKKFWHDYPSMEDWVLADENGNFDLKKLESVI